MSDETFLFGHYADQELLNRQIAWGRRVFAEAGVLPTDTCLAFTVRSNGLRPINYNRWWVFQPFSDGSLGFIVDEDTADRIARLGHLKLELTRKFSLGVGTWIVLQDADPDLFPSFVTTSAIDTLARLVAREYGKSPQAHRANSVYHSFFFREGHEDPALLLTWNPTEWPWTDLESDRNSTVVGVPIECEWRTLNRKDVYVGMRCYLLKQGAEPRGIMASGRVVRLPKPTGYVMANGNEQHSVQVDFDVLLEPTFEELLPRSVLLESHDLATVHWDTQASGILISRQQALALEAKWQHHLGAIMRADIDGSFKSVLENEHLEFQYTEGGSRQVSVNVRERSRAAREEAIKIHGVHCMCCGMSFGHVYGPKASGLIHVHHINPLYQQKGSVETALEDLVPVCPNCHAVIHLKKEMPYTVEELREMIRSAR